MQIKLLQGDCLDKLKELEDNSVDSIVTDPPYELGFMGKKWDSTGIANNVDMWKECLRVLKPGGHLLAFSGTRTYHRMASAIEDAGFEVRDMIEWVYGSGFPKSHNIGKAVDKLQGNEREDLGDIRKLQSYGYEGNNVFGGDIDRGGKMKITKGTSEWEGWGTALKPAHEPICMARKPLSEKTVAKNCLKWGTGGINIDESRVEKPEGDESGWSKTGSKAGENRAMSGANYEREAKPDANKRFPANLIHDNSEEVRECFPETKSGALKPYINKNTGSYSGSMPKFRDVTSESNEGNASRFFKSIIYQAKASKSERNKGCEGLEEKNINERKEGGKSIVEVSGASAKNNHPTVKPIALMEYLIKMVTPKGGTVLDPFMGSGSTGIAAKQNNYNFIGIEMEEDYITIAKARIDSVYEA